jgi:hypothetical protein
MSGEPQHPELIPRVLAYTCEVATATPWGIVTGTGQTPDDALQDLRRSAGKQGKEIFEQLWEQTSESPPKWRDKIAEKARKGALNASFSIGSTRLAYGASGWVAYGTLFTDSTGDGTDWLEAEARVRPGVT